ncbi:hypothetical protein CC86DRAFT_378494 [Ophiobolus disseminans]|uniref:Ig-like domain-containing protein n=1 Tax=Ophiobolus disseminans TaxID=1469910 RepID=A0A6A7AEQ6_9PLEO|nr:hypothetical protein CC86DRAFT_378494 [Ophiobolus disseminans]
MKIFVNFLLLLVALINLTGALPSLSRDKSSVAQTTSNLSARADQQLCSLSVHLVDCSPKQPKKGNMWIYKATFAGPDGKDIEGLTWANVRYGPSLSTPVYTNIEGKLRINAYSIPNNTAFHC